MGNERSEMSQPSYQPKSCAINARSWMRSHRACRCAFTMPPGNVIETHEHKGDFKEW